eukprot:9482527-Pyramimonas_sp.AAC.1
MRRTGLVGSDLDGLRPPPFGQGALERLQPSLPEVFAPRREHLDHLADLRVGRLDALLAALLLQRLREAGVEIAVLVGDFLVFARLRPMRIEETLPR